MSTEVDRLNWLDGDNVRPYVFVREENLQANPGSLFDSDWFPFEPLYLNPHHMDQVTWVDQILTLESKAFQKVGMAMPRWVFYDCGIMPGMIVGFAHRTATLPAPVREALGSAVQRDWTPISLFIFIPTASPGEWVAHNLSSVNSLLDKKDQFYGLGFLSKAFGLWYGNIKVLCGMTQWGSPALRLHSHYGEFEVLTAYTPAHTYSNTLTYRCFVDPKYWAQFFTHRVDSDFARRFEPAGFSIETGSEASQVMLQRRIERGDGPYFLDSSEIRTLPLDGSYQIFRCRP